MFDDVISTGLQAVLAEIFESVDKNQLNVSLVGDIFKESHLELTDLRLKKTLLKDMNLPVEVKEGLVGKLVIQGLSGEDFSLSVSWGVELVPCTCVRLPAVFVSWMVYLCLAFAFPSLCGSRFYFTHTRIKLDFENIRS